MSAWAITGVGIIAAIGDSAGCLFEALCARESLVRTLETPPGLPAAPVVGFDPKVYIARKGLRDLSRTSQLACAAAAQAAPAIEGLDGADVGVALGTAWGSLRTVVDFERAAQVNGPRFVDPLLFTETVSNVPAGQIAIFNGWSAFNATVAAGSASGLGAIGEAIDLLEEGRAVAALAGGADELNLPLLRALLKDGGLAPAPGSLPFGAGRRGPSGGEGACLLVIEDEDGARRRGADVLGRVLAFRLGFAGAIDPTRLGIDPMSPSMPGSGGGGEPAADHPNEARRIGFLADRLADCVRESLELASLAPREIDLLVLSANGSLGGDGAEARAVVSVFGEGPGAPPVLAPKAILGETWGASAPFALVAALEGMRRGMVPGMPEGFVAADEAAGLHFPKDTLERRIRRALVLALTESGHVGSLVVGDAT